VAAVKKAGAEAQILPDAAGFGRADRCYETHPESVG